MHEVESVRELRARLGPGRKLAEHPDRPRTRADCRDAPRPCPWVSCRHHLFLDVRRTGAIAYPHGTDVAALERLGDSCALDVAERGEATHAQVGQALNVTMQMASLIEQAALGRLEKHRGIEELT